MAMLRSVRAACPLASTRMLSGLMSLLGIRRHDHQKNLFYIPVHDPLAVKIRKTRGQLGHPKTNYVLGKIAPSVKMI
jgi:hypothetical protein